jgi:hypothetical protein
MAVLTDVGAEQIGLGPLELAVTVAQIDAAFADRLDLGPDERDARLELLEQVEVVAGLAVVGQRALVLVARHGQAG